MKFKLTISKRSDFDFTFLWFFLHARRFRDFGPSWVNESERPIEGEASADVETCWDFII